jgi:nucleoside-diphosphate-sugar epimerase
MTGQHVVVTGGCGYIGSVLVPRLQETPWVEGVLVLDNLESGSPRNLTAADVSSDDFRFRRGDVREYGAVESAVRGADAVIHLAAITGAASTHDRESETFDVNYHGTENVLRAVRKFDVDALAFASSCNNYGRTEHRELDETVETNPINPYAKAKQRAEDEIREYAEEYDINATALRLSTNYGYAPGVRFNLVVNTFVFRALTGRPLTVYGDGLNWRPFIHVEDAARAFADAVANPERWSEFVYNVGANAENYRIEDVAEAVQGELDRDLEITYLEEKRPGPSYHVSFDRLAETGFELEWDLRAGIRDLSRNLAGEGAGLDITADRDGQQEALDG